MKVPEFWDPVESRLSMDLQKLPGRRLWQMQAPLCPVHTRYSLCWSDPAASYDDGPCPLQAVASCSGRQAAGTPWTTLTRLGGVGSPAGMAPEAAAVESTLGRGWPQVPGAGWCLHLLAAPRLVGQGGHAREKRRFCLCSAFPMKKLCVPNKRILFLLLRGGSIRANRW